MAFFRTLLVVLAVLNSMKAQQIDTFNPLIECKDKDCHRVTLSFVYKSSSLVYNLVRNENLFDKDSNEGFTTNRYYINDKGTPFSAVRIGNSNEGVQGVISVDEELKSFAFDRTTGFHYFEAKGEEPRSLIPFNDEIVEARLGYFEEIGDVGGSERLNGSNPFLVKLTITIDKTALQKWFGGDQKKAKERAIEMTNIATRYFDIVNVQLTFLEFFVLDSDIGMRIEPMPIYLPTYRDAIKFKSFPKKNFHHLYHGLTGVYQTGSGVVGAAYTKGVCIPNNNVGVTTVTYDQVKLGSVAEMAYAMTHEIGHNLFLDHDPEASSADCLCDDPSGKCIMFPLKCNATTWSSCSKKVLKSLAVSIGNDPKNCPVTKVYLIWYILIGVLVAIIVVAVGLALYFDVCNPNTPQQAGLDSANQLLLPPNEEPAPPPEVRIPIPAVAPQNIEMQPRPAARVASPGNAPPPANVVVMDTNVDQAGGSKSPPGASKKND